MMPNPKMGTVTKDVAKAIKAAKAGAVKFKVEKKGIIYAGVGKLSFSNEALLGNIRAFMLAVIENKPEGLKGKYLTSVYLSSTMGPGVKIVLPSVDPGNARFMLNMDLP
jgi:large subunit ribosomal protein L1